MIAPTTSTALAPVHCGGRQLAGVRRGLGQITLPIIGEVSTVVLVAIVAAAVYFLFIRKGGVRRRVRAKRIRSRITEF